MCSSAWLYVLLHGFDNRDWYSVCDWGWQMPLEEVRTVAPASFRVPAYKCKGMLERKSGHWCSKREIGDNIVNVANCLLDCTSKAETDMKHVTGEQLQRVLNPVLNQCDEVLRRIACLRLPPVYPRLLELTDASPGVGVSSAESRIWILEKAWQWKGLENSLGKRRLGTEWSRAAQYMYRWCSVWWWQS